MNIWAKMMTALRGGINEAGEAIVDSQALRILDQEVREAAAELKQSENSLAEIIAQQKLSQQKSTAFISEIDEHEGYALKALDKGDEALALEVADKIAQLEADYRLEQESEAGFAANADKLRMVIAQTERTLKRLKQQIDTVKATENVQRAQAAVAERYSGSHSRLRTAMDSLERIKEKQALRDAQMAAADELAQQQPDVSLKAKLEQAGIATSGSDANQVLQRLKNKQ